MPQFDLRGLTVAKYVNTAGTISFTDRQSMGDAMTCNLELRFAEGRLYAESTLAEYLRKVIGGTVSVGAKYIKDGAQKLMYGVTEKSRNITYQASGTGTTTTATVKSLVTKRTTLSQYVGFGCYAPDMVDGVEMYTAFVCKKVRFGQPGYTLRTAGETITFNTPTTSGEFLSDDSSDGNLLEVVTVADENEAIAWINAVLT